MRLKAYYADSGGDHDILSAVIPMSAANVVSQGQNVFRTPVSSEWLQSSDIVRNGNDGVTATAPLDGAGGTNVVQSFVSSIASGMGMIEAWRNATDSGCARNACAIDKTVVPHVYWFWDEQTGTPIWTNAVKTAKGWERR